MKRLFKCPLCGKVQKHFLSNDIIRSLPRCKGKRCDLILNEEDTYIKISLWKRFKGLFKRKKKVEKVETVEKKSYRESMTPEEWRKTHIERKKYIKTRNNHLLTKEKMRQKNIQIGITLGERFISNLVNPTINGDGTS